MSAKSGPGVIPASTRLGPGSRGVTQPMNPGVSLSNPTHSGLLATSEGISSFDVDLDRFFIPDAQGLTLMSTPTQVFTPPLLSPFDSRCQFIISLGYFLFWRWNHCSDKE
jgi:hypothetical protein